MSLRGKSPHTTPSLSQPQVIPIFFTLTERVDVGAEKTTDQDVFNKRQLLEHGTLKSCTGELCYNKSTTEEESNPKSF